MAINEAQVKRKMENDLQKALALEAAKDYCKKNNLSLEKLKKQKFQIVYDSAIFAQPNNIIPNGLCNDLATQPKPTLIVKNNDLGLIVEQTEYTQKYLSL